MRVREYEQRVAVIDGWLSVSISPGTFAMTFELCIIGKRERERESLWQSNLASVLQLSWERE